MVVCFIKTVKVKSDGTMTFAELFVSIDNIWEILIDMFNSYIINLELNINI
jgi:hypothetical protein